MVEIYLNIHGSQAPFLSIPNSDVERLSQSPFKWLRYVMFSICGAPGDLSAMPNGPPVDYGSTLLANTMYYYNPSANCIFADHEGFNLEMIFSDFEECCSHSKEDVIQCDGKCIITQLPAVLCDAAHLIPCYKGDEYILKIVQDRSPLYGASPSISGIHDIQNQVLLTKTLHAMIADGTAAFIKTPNYGLAPSDIWRVNQGPECTDYITLQQLKIATGDVKLNLGPAQLTSQAQAWATGIGNPFAAFCSGGQMDALFQGTRLSLPPAIILDYVYGVSAYKCWRSN